jgi:ubiquinone/menaquinone biosynthesis C-methylase UbiE
MTMEISRDALGDVTRYLATHENIPLEEKKPDFENLLRCFRLAHPVGPGTRILEIGIGTGWFQVLCALNGMVCDGVEISPQLVDCARRMGAAHGVAVNVTLGNVEEMDLGEGVYDLVLALSVFEHVEHWEPALAKVYRALRPGGALLFESTNKFSFRSGEYPLAMYGWMPDWMRYRFRMMVQGPDIMKLGIDFHQFTYGRLRRAFRRAGFRQLLDRVDLANEAESAGSRAKVLRLCRQNRLIRKLVLTFGFDVTNYLCVK